MMKSTTVMIRAQTDMNVKDFSSAPAPKKKKTT